MKILLLATILATVSAYCPNACSGHGSCGINGRRFLGPFESFEIVSFPSSHLVFSFFRFDHFFTLQTNAHVICVLMVILHGLDMTVP